MVFGQSVLDTVFSISFFAFIFALPYLLQGYNRWQLTQRKESVASYVDQLEEVVKGYAEDQKENYDEIDWKLQLTMTKHVEGSSSEMEKEIYEQHDVIWNLVFKQIESWRKPSESTVRVRKRVEIKYTSSQSTEYPPQKSSGVTKEGAANTEVGQDNSSDEDKEMRSLMLFSNFAAELLILMLVTYVQDKSTDMYSSSNSKNQLVATICKCAVLYAMCAAISFHHRPGFLFVMTLLLTLPLVIFPFCKQMEENKDSVGQSREVVAEVQDGAVVADTVPQHSAKPQIND